MSNYIPIRLVIATAALLLSFVAYLFFKKNFGKIFKYAYVSLSVMLLLAGVAVTFIYS